jgi:nucleoside phosphorylase
VIDKIKDKQSEIESQINQHIKSQSFETEVTIKIAPMACSTMVINKEGFFEDTIKSINRDTAAVEMESYGVARACEFANEGNTTPIIFKAVMDFTKDKKDTIERETSAIPVNVKMFAATTSAQFMRCLFELKII